MSCLQHFQFSWILKTIRMALTIGPTKTPMLTGYRSSMSCNVSTRISSKRRSSCNHTFPALRIIRMHPSLIDCKITMVFDMAALCPVNQVWKICFHQLHYNPCLVPLRKSNECQKPRLIQDWLVRKLVSLSPLLHHYTSYKLLTLQKLFYT